MVLGFKVDPYEVLKKTMKEIQSLHQVYSTCPIFGVEYSDIEEGERPATPTTDTIQEDVELITTKKDTLAVSQSNLCNGTLFVYTCLGICIILFYLFNVYTYIPHFIFV